MGAQTGQSCGLYAADRTASPTGGSIDADALSVSPARIANIGPRERQRRLLVGFIGLGIGIAVAVGLYDVSTFVTLVVFMVLVGMRSVERKIRDKNNHHT